MTAPNLNPGESLPSPPPPPVISNGPSVPQIAAVAPLVVVDSAKPTGLESESDHLIGHNTEIEKNRGSYDSSRGRHRRTWADIKVKSEADDKQLSDKHEIGADTRQVSLSWTSKVHEVNDTAIMCTFYENEIM